MTTQYFVTAVTDCEECKGTGYVEHAAWHQLRSEYPVEQLVTWSETRLSGWFSDQGYSFIPLEQALCYECNGKKLIEQRVDLSKALAAVYRELELRIDQIEERLQTSLDAAAQAEFEATYRDLVMSAKSFLARARTAGSSAEDAALKAEDIIDRLLAVL